jgi:hypothetical protein
VHVKLWNCALALATLASVVPAHAQWQIENSGTTADLRGIDNVGGGIAWASGTNGTILRTEDAGYLWQPCTVPPGAEHLDFRGIQAFDADTAILMSSGKGDLSRLYKTNDGCQTWKLLFTNPDKDGFWDALDEGGKVIMILGDPVDGSFVLEESHDFGRTWLRDHLPSSMPGEGAFAASNPSLIADGADGILMFGTGGPSGPRIFLSCEPCTAKPFTRDAWAAQPMPMFGAGASVGISSISGNVLEGAEKFVAVGGDYSRPERPGMAVLTTHQDLFHWIAAATPPHGFRSAVAYDAGLKTWITVGPNGTDVSTDDGRNWRAVHPDPALREAPDADRNWNALSLPFVVGPHGRIGRLDPEALKP